MKTRAERAQRHADREREWANLHLICDHRPMQPDCDGCKVRTSILAALVSESCQDLLDSLDDPESLNKVVSCTCGFKSEPVTKRDADRIMAEHPSQCAATT